MTIPLFPLGTVLFPHGRISLQVFEPRYLDMITDCLKNDGGFGVVWLRRGEEIVKPNEEQDIRLAQVGSYARIVDWNSLSNGLLGITIEGGSKFRLLSSYQQANHLHLADVEWIDDEEPIALPDSAKELLGLLEQLMSHPHVVRLGINSDISDVNTLSYVLAQLLPMPESVKFSLLSQNDPFLRLEQISQWLDEYSE